MSYKMTQNEQPKKYCINCKNFRTTSFYTFYCDKYFLTNIIDPNLEHYETIYPPKQMPKTIKKLKWIGGNYYIHNRYNDCLYYKDNLKNLFKNFFSFLLKKKNQ